MKIDIDKKELKFVIESWEGHIINDTSCSECKEKSVKCPVNNFFKKLKRQLRTEKEHKR